MTGKRRVISVVVSVVFTTLGCLDPIEPTPDSAPLSIAPGVAAVPVQSVGGSFSFAVSLQIINRGTRPVYVDAFYRRTEKLVDQKWKLAAESTPTDLFRAIAPNETLRLVYSVAYKSGTDHPLFDPVRGLYRVGLRAFYEPNGSSPTSAQPSYSSPFVLVDPNAGN